jgi:hypothetical protein
MLLLIISMLLRMFTISNKFDEDALYSQLSTIAAERMDIRDYTFSRGEF